MNAPTDKAAILASLPVRPDEDPFAVTIGDFYRRWFNLLDDLNTLINTVKRLEGTEDEVWVPAWSTVAQKYEQEAKAAVARGDRNAARRSCARSKSSSLAAWAAVRPSSTISVEYPAALKPFSRNEAIPGSSSAIRILATTLPLRRERRGGRW